MNAFINGDRLNAGGGGMVRRKTEEVKEVREYNTEMKERGQGKEERDQKTAIWTDAGERRKTVRERNGTRRMRNCEKKLRQLHSGGTLEENDFLLF